MTAAVAPRATRRDWIGLAVLALPTLLLSVDMNVLLLALPRLNADLHPSSVQQLWIMDMYGFMLAGFLVTMGILGDRVGRRRLLMIGATVFAAASVLAAYAGSPGILIAARALMGIAGATLMPATLTLITIMFRDPRQHAVAVATWMSCLMAGGVLGPVVGGLLLQKFWWGSIFLMAIPVMALLLVTAPVLLPEHRAESAGRMDPASVALSLLAILSTIYGLKELARYGWQPLPVVAVVLGVALGVVFVIRQRLLPQPLLDLSLFSNKVFSSALSMMFFGGIFLGGTTLLVTQFLQLVQGLSPLAAGLWLVPAVVAMIIGAQLGPTLARGIRPAYVMSGGLLIAALGYGLVTQVHSVGGLAMIVIGWAVVLAGGGLPAGLGVGLMLGSVPPEKAGAASAVQQTGTELGLALGIAVVGSIGAAVYRAQIAGHLPAGVPAQAAEAARDNINSGLAAAGQFPELVAPVRAAYTAALNVAGGLSAAVAVISAVFVAVAIRGVPPFTRRQPQPAESDLTANDTAPASARTAD